MRKKPGSLIEQMLEDESSPQGREKAAALMKRGERGGVMTPLFSQQPDAISHRISWEKLAEHIAAHKSRLVARMKRAEVGAESGEALRQLAWVSPVEMFVKGCLLALDEVIEDFDPDNGFDLDLFLQVENLGINNNATVLYEMFPRKRAGQLSTAYCARTMFRAPLLTQGGVLKDGILQNLAFTGGIRKGEDLSALRARWCEQQQGCWRLDEEVEIDLLINCCCISILKAGGYELGTTYGAVVHEGAHGRVLEASLSVIHLRS